MRGNPQRGTGWEIIPLLGFGLGLSLLPKGKLRGPLAVAVFIIALLLD